MHKAMSRELFESCSPAELMKNTQQVFDELNKNGEDISELTDKELRLKQYLILTKKRTEIKIEPDYIFKYLKETQPCLNSPDECIQKSKQENNDHLGAFYSWLAKDEVKEINKSLQEIKNSDDLSSFRAKVLNLIFNSLKLGIEEFDGPNDDSRTKDAQIDQIFKAAGISNPRRELPESKIDWAWCAAYVTAIVNQAGSGFTFLSLSELLNTCKEMDRSQHCHPIQVEYILNWARKKAKVNDFKDKALKQIEPGDILVLLNPKNGRASHIGFYIAQNEACKEDSDKCWVYSIEGNAGPFVNDKLEEKWSEVQSLIKEKKVSNFDYERLLDRLTIVKRPIRNWDYVISLDSL